MEDTDKCEMKYKDKEEKMSLLTGSECVLCLKPAAF